MGEQSIGTLIALVQLAGTVVTGILTLMINGRISDLKVYMHENFVRKADK